MTAGIGDSSDPLGLPFAGLGWCSKRQQPIGRDGSRLESGLGGMEKRRAARAGSKDHKHAGGRARLARRGVAAASAVRLACCCAGLGAPRPRVAGRGKHHDWLKTAGAKPLRMLAPAFACQAARPSVLGLSAAGTDGGSYALDWSSESSPRISHLVRRAQKQFVQTILR